MDLLPPPSPAPLATARWPRLEPWLAATVVLGACVGLVWHCYYLAVPIVDDAAISLAYGLTFFSGEGLRITPHSQPVEGFSNPVWMLLQGLSRPLRLEPVSYSHHLGILLGTLALPAFALWGPAAEGRRLRLEDGVGPLVAAALPSYPCWISSGMETGLVALLLGLCGALVLWELRTGRSSHSGWALGLLCLTRPEGVLFAGASGALWVVSRTLRRQYPGRQELRIAAWLLALVGSWLVLRWAYFADWLPNTYYAKRGWDFNPKHYLTSFWETYQVPCAVALLGLALGLLGGQAPRRRTVLAALFLACGIFFAWSAQGDWMREWRFLAPLMPLLGVAAAAGLSSIRELARRLEARRQVWAARALVVLAVLAVLGPLARGLREGLERSAGVKAGPELPFEFISSLAREVLARTRSLSQSHPLLAYPDMGGLAMVLPNADVLDVAGLADYAIAHHNGNPAAQEDYLLSEGLPVLMDVHGPSNYLGGFHRLLERFHPIGGPFFMLNGLTPDEDPRCPEGKASTLALAPLALARRFEQDIRADQAPQALMRWRCVQAYKERQELPAKHFLVLLAMLADARGDALVRQGKLEPALRQYSLATLLDDGAAHRRRKTEKLRARLFPPPASAP